MLDLYVHVPTVAAVATGSMEALGGNRVDLGGPTTLELGLIGAGIIAVYAVTTRSLAQRRSRTSPSSLEIRAVVETPMATSVSESTPHTPSRGAA